MIAGGFAHVPFCGLQQYLPFTVLKPTTADFILAQPLALQQYLPFTVLKPTSLSAPQVPRAFSLQQYLPFTVLKPLVNNNASGTHCQVATVLTVYGIET